MPVLRRVWGEATDATYFAFRDRALHDPSLQHLSERDRVAAAMNALVIGYSQGFNLVRPKPVKEHAKGEGVRYGS